MVVVPQDERNKLIAFRSNYGSTTFREYFRRILGANRILSGLTVTSDGVDASTTDGVFVQRGVFVDVQNVPDVTIPGSFPAYLVIDNVDQIPTTDVSIQFYEEADFLANPDLCLLAIFTDANTLTQPPALDHETVHDLANMIVPYPNMIKNGGFEIDQRGIVANRVGPGIGPFGPDGWMPWVVTGSTGTSSIERTGAAGEFFSGLFGGKCVVTVGDSVRCGVTQRLFAGDVLPMVGFRITFSVMVKATAAATLTIQATDGGSFLTVGTGSYRTHSGSGDWEHLSTYLDVPANADRLEIAILSDFDQTFFIDDAILAPGGGNFRIPYIPDTNAEETRKVLRLYETGFFKESFLGSDDGTDYTMGCRVLFKQPKNFVPTVTLTNVVINEDGSATDESGSYTVSTSDIDRLGFTVKATKPNGGGDDPRPNHLEFNWAASSS
jgi:hypothetical protein